MLNKFDASFAFSNFWLLLLCTISDFKLKTGWVKAAANICCCCEEKKLSFLFNHEFYYFDKWGNISPNQNIFFFALETKKLFEASAFSSHLTKCEGFLLTGVSGDGRKELDGKKQTNKKFESI